MLEWIMIEHCAPTLAGLKTAGLINYRFLSEEVLGREVEEENQKLNKKGVFLDILKKKNQQALVYVYRRDRLAEDLKKKGVAEELLQYGYTEHGPNACLQHLKKRLDHMECFPHEIGLFLGYPLEDVRGFIEHKGKDCKCCGAWKVYCNEYEAVRLFEKFRKCTELYLQLYANGRTVMQLTVG